MEVVFNNLELKQLYLKGSSKAYKAVDMGIVKKMVRAVELLKSSTRIEDIWKFPAYKFEKLSGHSNRYSMRMNLKWRLEMSIDWEDDTCRIGIIGLEDLSPHYGD